MKQSKSSKTPFTVKYEYEAKLYKNLLTSTIGAEIDTVLVFNPFAEIFVSKI